MTTEPFGWFDELYGEARGEISGVPWEGKAPLARLKQRLDSVARQAEAGADKLRAVDVGCGLGRHAELLAGFGFNVTGFDVSETAIAWARQRFTDSTVRYRVANLFALPADMVGAFDLVHRPTGGEPQHHLLGRAGGLQWRGRVT